MGVSRPGTRLYAHGTSSPGGGCNWRNFRCRGRGRIDRSIRPPKKPRLRRARWCSRATLHLSSILRWHSCRRHIEVGIATDHRGGPPLPHLAASEAGPRSSPQNPANVSALAETPAAVASTPPANEPVVTADAVPVQKKAAKKQPQRQQRLTWRAPREQVYGAAREQAYGSARTPLALLPNGASWMRGQDFGPFQARGDF